METVVVKRRGNPTFFKKKDEPAVELDQNKQYVFQLLKTHEKQKPVDGKTGEIATSPYQPFYGVVNSGIAWDPDYTPKGSSKKGAQRRWRYLHGWPTIWVDEQVDPEPTKEDLSQPENDLVFRFGVLRVFAHQTTKLQALRLNNTFEGCVRPLKNLPFEYKLLDQDKIDKEVLETLDSAFEAEKTAREASLDEMYALAYFYGIDLAKSDDAIRKEFITKARTNPVVFNREFANPKNKMKYIFQWGLSDNVISGTIVPGTVYLVDSNTKVWDLRSENIVEELAAATFAGDKEARKLYDQLNNMYNAD